MKTLFSFQEVEQMIHDGKMLLLGATDTLLAKLPKGNWIGGSIPYFMSERGGLYSDNEIYVDTVPSDAHIVSIINYDAASIPNVTADAPENGLSIIIIPAFTEVHTEYAENAIMYNNIFAKPITGWVAGTHVDEIGKTKPTVFNGKTGERLDDKAVVMHCELPDGIQARLEIVNLFTQGAGDTLTFEKTGFAQTECFVNGVKSSFAEVMKKYNGDLRLPLVADYYGAMINVCFANIDEATQSVSMFAPVLKGVEYKLATPLSKPYDTAFNELLATQQNASPVFSCNCILNYLYAELEGKKLTITGPMTFGEINYVLFNQTLVSATFEHVG